MAAARRRAFVVCAVIALSLVSCASLGGGDPLVVRGEDVLVNSLAFYDVSTDWHYANSRTESPALYSAFEKFRKGFPKAWGTAKAAMAAYKASRGADQKIALDKALASVEQLLADIRSVWTPPPVKVP